MAYMENPALGGASVSQAGELDERKHTRTPDPTQAALGVLRAGLRWKPRPQSMAPALRALMAEEDRLWATVAFLASLPRPTLWRLTDAMQVDLAHPPGSDREAERMRCQWIRHCATTRPVRRARR